MGEATAPQRWFGGLRRPPVVRTGWDLFPGVDQIGYVANVRFLFSNGEAEWATTPPQGGGGGLP